MQRCVSRACSCACWLCGLRDSASRAGRHVPVRPAAVRGSFVSRGSSERGECGSPVGVPVWRVSPSHGRVGLMVQCICEHSRRERRRLSCAVRLRLVIIGRQRDRVVRGRSQSSLHVCVLSRRRHLAGAPQRVARRGQRFVERAVSQCSVPSLLAAGFSCVDWFVGVLFVWVWVGLGVSVGLASAVFFCCVLGVLAAPV